MDQSYKRLLPKPSEGSDGVDGVNSAEVSPLHTPSTSDDVSPRRRPHTGTACRECSNKKTKCDGIRPACSRCRSKLLDCAYEADEDATRAVTLKRKFEALQIEHSQLKELYGYIHDRPELEAYEIFSRIRSSNDPIAVLEAVKAAELLLPSSGTTSSSIPNSARSSDPRMNS